MTYRDYEWMEAGGAERRGRLDSAPFDDPHLPDIYADEEELDDEPTMGGGAAVRDLFTEAGAEEDEPTGVHAFFALRAGSCTDVGRLRRANEDTVLVLNEKAVYAVADGMGGHRGGALASQLAIEAIATTFLDGTPMPCVLSNVPARGAELVQSFAAANEAVRSAASKDPALAEMGTTIVAARFCSHKGRLYVGHIGDSRCYRLRDGLLEQVTRDHTLAELGVSGREARHLSRAVGPSGIVEADLAILSPRADDVYLLCSDGLNKMVTSGEIEDILTRETDPEAAAAELVATANRHGGKDNVSAVVLRIEEADPRFEGCV